MDKKVFFILLLVLTIGFSACNKENKVCNTVLTFIFSGLFIYKHVFKVFDVPYCFVYIVACQGFACENYSGTFMSFFMYIMVWVHKRRFFVLFDLPLYSDGLLLVLFFLRK